MKRCNSSEDCHEFRKKEPHLQVQEVTLRGKSTQSSSSTVKSVLKRSIELKQAQRKEEEEKRKEDTASKCKDNLALKQWPTILSDAGYYCEVRSLVKSMDFMPFPESKEAPCFALIVERSRDLPFSEISGPFQAARLLVYPNGEWQIDSPIVEYRRLQVGMLSMPIKSGQLIDLARKWLSEKHVLCPGLVGSDGEKLEKELGYIPKNVSVYGRNYVRSVGCKIWHVPGSNYDQMQKMCGECLECYRYVKNALAKKQSLNSSKREKRRNPSSNYAIKYLTPRSKSIRLGKTRKLRSRMTKKVRRLYKQTSIELPQEQSSVLCKLVQEIENSNEGKQELETIFSEGNQLTDKKGCKAGNCVKGIWEKDRDGFFKDQRKNGEF